VAKEQLDQFNCKIPADLHKRVKLLSVEKGLKIQEFVQTALEEKLERDTGSSGAKKLFSLPVTSTRKRPKGS